MGGRFYKNFLLYDMNNPLNLGKTSLFVNISFEKKLMQN